MLEQELAVGMLTNGLWELIGAPLYRAGYRRVHPKQSPTGIDESISIVATRLSGRYRDTEPTDDQWRSLLTAPEVREALSLLFETRFTLAELDIEDVKSAFLAGVEHAAQGRAVFSGVDFDELFASFVEASAEVVELAIEADSVHALENSAELRHKIVIARIKAIEDLCAPHSASAGVDLSDLEQQLRLEVSARSGRIDLPSTVRHEPVDIDSLYVAPQLRLSSESLPRFRYKPEERSLDYPEFLTSVRRRVVLGNPGAGKSTLAVKLCSDLTSAPTSPIRSSALSWESITPLRVELRKYHASGEGLMRYCERLLSSDYMLDYGSGAFHELLRRRHILVIFDGLDEILDTGERRTVRNVIEAFCRRYPSTDVLVTSRVVGYDQAPLDTAAFDLVYIDDFDEARVKQYAGNWFSLDESKDLDQAKQHAATFLEESAEVSDLRANPLLLSLLCALYRGQGYIPDNLPDIYEQCSLLLFQTWDKSRGIEPVLPFARHVQPALQDMAYWMYSDPRLAGGITSRQAVARVAEYLSRWRFKDRAEAEGAARDFVAFCRDRAWVFSDQQSTSEAGEDLFAFTHRTFLEYFTAMYLVSVRDSVESLVADLLPRIRQGEWDVVCRIALQSYARGRLGGADELVKEMLRGATNGLPEDRRPVFEMLLRSIGALVPTPESLSELGTQLVEHLLLTKGVSGDSRRMILHLVEETGTEVRSTLVDSIRTGVVDLFRSPSNTAQRSSAAFIGGARFEGFPELEQAFVNLDDHDRLVIREAARADVVVARDLWPRFVDGLELVRWHGLEGVFRGRQKYLSIDLVTDSNVLDDMVLQADSDHGEMMVDVLALLGRSFVGVRVPTCPKSVVVVSVGWLTQLIKAAEAKHVAKALVLEEDVRLGLWLLVAAYVEATKRTNLMTSKDQRVRMIVDLARCRISAVKPSTITDVTSHAAVQTALHRWCAGDASVLV